MFFSIESIHLVWIIPLSIIAGIVFFVAFYKYRGKLHVNSITNTKIEADKIINDAKQEAENIIDEAEKSKKTLVYEGKNEILAYKNEVEKEFNVSPDGWS